MVFNQILNSLPDLDELPTLKSVDFNETGELVPGDFAPSKDEFENTFVNIGDIKKRNNIYNGWIDHRSALINDGLAGESRILLNGSYTSKENSPNDIDLVVEVPITSEK